MELLETVSIARLRCTQGVRHVGERNEECTRHSNWSAGLGPRVKSGFAGAAPSWSEKSATRILIFVVPHRQ